MKAATLFSGIGAPETAMPHWHWLWHAEIEPFPSAVMAARHPGSINLGDVSAPDFVERALNAGRPDVLVFGSPCQSFSVAGKRLGLDDPRGNLALVALGLAQQLRPEWLVFENVPGLLSSSGGDDFAAFLSVMGQCGYFGAWRVLDAQYAGVPQRRRRVFFVGHLGDWRRAAAVLFEPASLRGNPAPRREAGEGVAAFACQGTNVGEFGTLRSGNGHLPGGLPFVASTGRQWPADTACTLNAHFGDKWGLEDQHALNGAELFVPATAHTLRGDGFDAGEDGTGRGTPLVPVAFDVRQSDVCIYGDRAAPLDTDRYSQAIAFSCKDHGTDAGDLAPTLRAMGHGDSHANGGGQIAVAFDTTQITSAANYSNPKPDDPCHPLAAGAHPPAVAFDWQKGDGGSDDSFRGKSRSWITRAGDYTGALGATKRDGVAYGSAVRRLTPVECHRLQGFPDDHCAIVYRGKPAADGPQYKALGNSMAVPVVRWILSRLERAA